MPTRKNHLPRKATALLFWWETKHPSTTSKSRLRHPSTTSSLFGSEQILMISGRGYHSNSSGDRKRIRGDVIDYPYQFSNINHIQFLKEFLTGKIGFNGKVNETKRPMEFGIDMAALWSTQDNKKDVVS